jgi:two-component system cell cycle sensor histidine kinase/response regulator CckA
MASDRSPDLSARLRSASVGAGVLAALTGVAVLTHRLLGATISTRPASVPTMTDTAVGLVLAGVALVFLGKGSGRRPRRVAKALAVMVALGALLEAAEYVAGRDLGPESLRLLRIFAAPGPHPGRMAITTIAGFLLVAGALLSLDLETPRGRWAAPIAGLGVAWLAHLSVIGAAYGVDPLRTLGFHIRMGVPTATAFLLLGVGIVLARPERGPTAVLTSDGPRGLATRRLLPAAVVLPPVLGWLVLWGERLGVYSIAFGAAALASCSIVLFSALVWWSAAPLDRLEAERRRAHEELKVAEARFRGLLEAAPDAIIGADHDGRIILVNRQAERAFGYSREEVIGQPEETLLPERPRARQPEGRRACLSEAPPGALGPGIDRVAQRKDGSEFPVEITLSSLPTETGLAVMGIVRDVSERYAADEALRESEERFRATFEQAAVGIAHVALDGRFIRLNRRFAEIVGYTPEEMTALTFQAITHPGDLEATLAYVEKMLSGAIATYSMEKRYLHKAGWHEWVNLTVSLVRRPGGEPNYFIAVVEDITDRKRAEEALRASEQQLQAVLDGTTALVYVKDTEGRYLLVNRRFEERFGVSRDRMGGTTDDDWFPKELADSYRANDRLVLETRVPLQIEEDTLEDDGPHTYLSVKVPLLDARGMPEAVCGISTDITERKRGEEERARLGLAVEQSPSSILMTDPQGIVFFVNPAFETLSGYPRHEILGQNPRILKSGKHSALFYRELWATLTRGETWRGRMVNRRKDGSLFEAESTVSPVLNGDGMVIAYVAAMRDVTSERQMEEQLLQLQKMEMVGRLAGGVAHDFNNLLLVIDGHSELLLRELGPDHAAQRRVRLIKDAGERGASLTRQLLAFSRKQVLELRVLDLNDVVIELEEMLRRLIGEDVELVTKLTTDPVRVRADRGQLEQVIVNLAVNARDAMPGGGRLILETALVDLAEVPGRPHPGAPPETHAALKVCDTGHGMDAGTLSHIFEPFFTTKEPGKGTGLGLSTVYGIVDQSGGRVDVESEPGRGSTFRILLPNVEEPVDSPPAVSPPQVPAVDEGTILLVEDETALRSLLREVLEDHGFRVLEASDPEEALAAAASAPGPIHLVLTDVVMPRMCGRAGVERVLTLQPQAKVLFMSGYTADVVGPQLNRESRVHFIQKPFTPGALLQKLQEVLGEPDPGHL